MNRELYKKIRYFQDMDNTIEKKKIHIVCATDRTYVRGVTVVGRSISYHLSQEYTVQLHVLETKLTSSDIELINKLNELENICVNIIHLDATVFQNFKEMKHLSVAAYYRLVIPDVLPESIDKCIYLDTDIVVNADISELWEKPIGDKYVLATTDETIRIVSHPYGITKYQEMGLEKDTEYFNSGVMVFNLPLWRKDNITQQLLQNVTEYGEYNQLCDQDSLNAILAEKWTSFGREWNFQVTLAVPKKGVENGQNIILKGRPNFIKNSIGGEPKIIHFTSDEKPWKRDTIPYKEVYDQFALFEEEVDSNNEEEPFRIMGFSNQKEIMKETLVYHGGTARIRNPPTGIPSEAKFAFHDFSCQPAYIYALKKVYSTSKGNTLNENRLLIPKVSYYINHKLENLIESFPENTQVKEIKGRVVSLTHGYDSVFGDWMCMILPRLHLLEKQKIKYDYLYVNQKHKFQRESLEVLGIDKSKIIDSSKTQIIKTDELIIPTPAGQEFPWIYSFLKKKFLPRIKRTNTTPKRIYIPRPQFNRQIVGEDFIIKKLKQRGFTIFKPEEHSLLEQIETYAHAEAVVSIQGSSLTNTLFCNKSTKIIAIIFKKRLYIHEWYSSAFMGTKFYYLIQDGIVLNKESIYDRASGEIHLNRDEFLAILEIAKLN